MSAELLLAAAIEAAKAGISIIPIAADGNKRPAGGKWGRWQNEIADEATLHRWYLDEGHPGIAVVGGPVSGGLEILDIEGAAVADDIWWRFLDACAEAGHGAAIDRIRAGYEEVTPSDGRHLLYRCAVTEGNVRLACRPKRPEEMVSPNDKVQVLIETRGDGGYAVVAPTNGRVHKNGKPWVLQSGGFATVATITPEEREAIHRIARTFDQMPVRRVTGAPGGATSTGNRVGDDFNARASWDDILGPAGWTVQWVADGKAVVTRPGKDPRDGHSGTINHDGTGRLFVFTTASILEANRYYDKLGAYARLHHDGDIAAAVRMLSEHGYGRAAGTAEAAPAEWRTTFPQPVEVDEEALYGLPGRVVRELVSYTEAPLVTLLAQFLAAFGCAVGRGPGFHVGGTIHRPNLFVAVIGESSQARKGSGLDIVLLPMAWADPAWNSDCRVGGLSTGEGLIERLRDPIYNAKGECTDPGVVDKRLLVVETEFSRPLRAARREGNILTVTLRQAWDGITLETLTKKDPRRASNSHVAIIGHTTRADLRKYLDDTDILNGFANRWIWIASKRVRLLSNPPDVPPELIDDLGREIQRALAAAKGITRMRRSPAASKLWDEIYRKMAATQRFGAFGAATGRAEAQMLRLSMLYALTDGSAEISVDHLRAAMSLWKFAEQTAVWVFGWTTGDSVADTILGELRAVYPDSLLRNDIRRIIGSKVSLDDSLSLLETLGLATKEQVTTGTRGRPPQRWTANPQPPISELVHFDRPP